MRITEEIKLRNVYLDTETTDLNPGQIAELSMIVEDGDTSKILGCYNYYFSVDSVEPGAQEIHGFSKELLEELSDGKKFSDHYKDILQILTDANLVAHNEKFDEKFISSELWRCGISFKPACSTCTMEAFKQVLKIPARSKRYGPYKNPKLSEVINFLGINEKKVAEYTVKLFGTSNKEDCYHDSRFDTTGMYVAVQVYRETLHGGTAWHEHFCS